MTRSLLTAYRDCLELFGEGPDFLGPWKSIETWGIRGLKMQTLIFYTYNNLDINYQKRNSVLNSNAFRLGGLNLRISLVRRLKTTILKFLSFFHLQ